MFFDRLFPAQVEQGEKQSTTIDWIMKRTADGSGLSQPREVILFLNKLCELQNKKLEEGSQEPAGEHLFDRSIFKEALPALSDYRATKVLFAEYKNLRLYLESMRDHKTEQNAKTLAKIWKTSEENALIIARQLKDVGFFEERNTRISPTFWIPFIYRPYFSLSQGKEEGF